MLAIAPAVEPDCWAFAREQTAHSDTAEKILPRAIWQGAPFPCRRSWSQNLIGSPAALRQLRQSVGVELWRRRARLERWRLLFAKNERPLKQYTRKLHSRANVTSDLAGARSIKLQLEFIVAAEDRVPLGMPFGRDGRGESISVDHANAAIGHDAVAAPNFPISDMGNARTLALRGLEPRRISAVFETCRRSERRLVEDDRK
jgi:hypothetical protein